MLILASGSPRRQEILTTLGFDFLCQPADADETIAPGTSPEAAVAMLAQRKARAVLPLHPTDTVLGADTVVALGQDILGKPADADQARAMLTALSGKSHTVYTGVSIITASQAKTFVSATQVTFFPLSQTEIDAYIATGDPMDKAGAYGIQGPGQVLISGIQGDYFTVVGLPGALTARALREFGIFSCHDPAAKASNQIHE